MPTIRSSVEVAGATTSADVVYDSSPPTIEAPSSLHILSDVSRNDTLEHLESDQLGTITINSQMTTLRPTIIIYPTGNV